MNNVDIDWENLKEPDLYDISLYEKILSVSNTIERSKYKEELFKVAKKMKIKTTIEKNFNNFEKEQELNKQAGSIIDFGDKAPIKKMMVPGYYKDKFKELDLESIDITKTILDGLSEELDIKKNKFLENYMINEDRLEDEKVINFYDILFNFILKQPKYIYINNFLIINRNNFSELLKNNSKKCKFKQFILNSFFFYFNDDTKNLVNYNSFSNSMFLKDIK